MYIGTKRSEVLKDAMDVDVSNNDFWLRLKECDNLMALFWFLGEKKREVHYLNQSLAIHRDILIAIEKVSCLSGIYDHYCNRAKILEILIEKMNDD